MAPWAIRSTKTYPGSYHHPSKKQAILANLVHRSRALSDKESLYDEPEFLYFNFVSMHHSISQIKHQLDATLCRFYFCRVTLHVPGASAHHHEYLKLVQRPLVHVLSLQVSHHISLLGPFRP